MPILELKWKQAVQPLTDAWQHVPVAPRLSTLLGISFRSPQLAAFGLEPRATLDALLPYPFQLLRIGAYWSHIEPRPGEFHTDELDWQIDSAERAGKRVILCVGPIKTFGYPEFFVPAHYLSPALKEHTRIRPAEYPALLQAAGAFMTRVVERFKGRESIVAWQLEHEPVDPLGVEHSWRLDAKFVEAELQTLRDADPTRPVLMNGFLPTSVPVRLSQWWRTRDQGDSLDVAQRLADMVGIDYYPRHALAAIGGRTVYLDGSGGGWQYQRRKELLRWAGIHGKPLLITEGQAEPWEAVTIPPNPETSAMYSCMPENLIANYNAWMEVIEPQTTLYAYLFWGAEYWILRQQCGDASYLGAFARILEHA